MRVPPITLKAKLLLSLLGVVLLTGAGSWMVGWLIIEKNIVNQAYENVANTLEMYGDIYQNRLYVKHRLINTVAAYSVFQEDVEEQKIETIRAVLADLLRETRFDILNVTDASGRVLVRSKNPRHRGDFVTSDAYVKRVLNDKKPHFGFDVMDRASLLNESDSLADRAVIDVIPTERSRNTDQKTETAGLFLKAASPIFRSGVLVGVIYGAVLLNKDTEIPDQAKTLVFGDEQIDRQDIGTATLFLGDLRISTNVRTKGGERAIGTLVSQEVYQKVFEEGKVWKDRAFVVDNWYIAAYKPIRDLDQKIIGIIYTGILAEKYQRIQRSAVSLFLLVIFITGVLSILLASWLLSHLIHPITALKEAAERIIRGEYHKVKITSKDEMGYLGFVFNRMVDSLIEKDRVLMEHVEKQIQQTEKLASLGRLSSGIAHEINNPLTGVLTYSSMLLEDLKGTPHEADLIVVREETLRCREIVREMLEFARETKLDPEQININKIISSVVSIIDKHISFHNIKIIQELDPDLPESYLDINQMKSVISNLVVNAADAMPGGGTLKITTNTLDDKIIIIQVSDTGTGISEENLPKVFDPFFTTKDPGKGTGLGLSVTYGIIKRHNGSIEITSQVGVGTTVEIHIPVLKKEAA